MNRIRLLAVIALICLPAPGVLAAPSWTPWERENAVGQFRSFLVIRQPGETRCYVKQSFYNDEGKMELIFAGDAVTVAIPHIASGRWDVTYWVDSGEQRTISHEAIMAPDSFRLPPDRLADLEAGNYLNVRVSPEGEAPFSQTISLLGFTAASRKLADPECTGAVAFHHQQALDPAAAVVPNGGADEPAPDGG